MVEWWCCVSRGGVRGRRRGREEGGWVAYRRCVCGVFHVCVLHCVLCVALCVASVCVSVFIVFVCGFGEVVRACVYVEREGGNGGMRVGVWVWCGREWE